VKSDAEKYLAVVKLLMTSPEEKDLTVIFPKNAKINDVRFDNGTAFVDLDKNITKSFAGGSTGEELLVNSVVKTLTEFKEVKQVRFLIDGAEIETLSGHMDLSTPIKRTDL
jgi:spore germination protein GerM